jgi:hypothetical protein
VPLTPSTMRVGEEITLTGDPKDADGNPIEANNPTWSQTGTPDDILTVTPAGLSATVLAVQPGTDTVELTGDDSFSNPISAEQDFTVLDASRFEFVPYDPVDCDLKWVGDVLHVIPNGTGSGAFFLKIIPRDSRSEDRGQVTYALSDGPDLSTDTQKLRFGGGGATTSNNDGDVQVDYVDVGDEVIHATGVTDATGATVTGDLSVRIRALATIGPLVVS